MRGLVFIILFAAAVAPAGAADDEVWAKLKAPGHIALMRHANAPGLGEEPPGIDLKNCAIQRNLDDKGKAQARAIGSELRKRGLANVHVLSSQFCRALDTGKLMNVGKVVPAPVLNYFNFNDEYRLAAEAQKTIAFMKKLPPKPVAILVTHISNIKAIAGETVSSGEMVVVHFENGKLAVDGRIPAP
jgi:phosphohistidine phosphatase SixA